MEENLEADQVQKDSPQKQEGYPKVESKKPAKLEKDQAPTEQSEKSEEVTGSPKTYKTPDGRELSPDEIYEEYNKLHPEFTRRSQELAELKRQQTEAQERNKNAAEQAVSQNKLLEDVDPNVRDAIVQIVSPVIQEALNAKEKEAAAKASQEAFDKRLTELETKYPGGDGLPKFDKLKILKEMQSPTNEIYDPEVLYQKMNWDSYVDAQIKRAIKGKSGGVQTERTSTEAPRKPGETKPPTTWEEASRNAVNRS